MGSSGYLTCGICWQCGKCYPRRQACASCGKPINLDESACALCGEPVTEAMRQHAREIFKQEKLQEFQATFKRRRDEPRN